MSRRHFEDVAQELDSPALDQWLGRATRIYRIGPAGNRILKRVLQLGNSSKLSKTKLLDEAYQHFDSEKVGTLVLRKIKKAEAEHDFDSLVTVEAIIRDPLRKVRSGESCWIIGDVANEDYRKIVAKIEAIQTQEKDTVPIHLGPAAFPPEIVKAVASALRLNHDDLLRAMQAAQGRGADLAPTPARKSAGQMASEQIERLQAYYRPSLPAGFGFFTVFLKSRAIKTDLVVRKEWLSREHSGPDKWKFRVNVRAADEREKLPQLSVRPVADTMVEMSRSRESLSKRGHPEEPWNELKFLLRDIQHAEPETLVTFDVATFFEHRFTNGTLERESARNLEKPGRATVGVSRNDDDDRRRRLLPDGPALVDVGGRLAISGVECVTAFAEADASQGAGPTDYAIPIGERSSEVADNRGMLSVIPRSFHDCPGVPPSDYERHCNPRESVFRELYEELFSGMRVESGDKRLDPRWFMKSVKPLAWFEAHERKYDIQLLGLGISALHGNATFATLLQVDDPSYLREFVQDMEASWEIKDRVVHWIRTSQPRACLETLSNPRLSSETRFALSLALGRMWNKTGQSEWAKRIVFS